MAPKNKVNKPKRAARPPVIAVRLPKNLLAWVDQDAEKTGRTRYAVIVEAVRQSYFGEYGWSEPLRAKLLSQAVGVLAGEIQDMGGKDHSDHPKASVAAMLKIAISDLLDGLGADDASLTDEDRLAAKLRAREMVNQMRWAGLISPEEREMHHTKGIIADLGKAWGVKTGKGKGE